MSIENPTKNNLNEGLQRKAYYVQCDKKFSTANEYVCEGEALEDLGIDGLFILQQKDGYRFTSDAVLLANSLASQRGKKVVELCSGSGVIAILTAAKKQADQIVAVELQPDLAQMSARSVALCGLCDKIRVICGDVKGIEDTLEKHSFDTVICNPPYRKIDSGQRQENTRIAICRHEITLTLSDVVFASAALLKNKGEFYLVHQSERLCEIVKLCALSKMEVKQIIPICARQNQEAKTVIVRAVKNAKSGLTISAPIYIYDEQGNYTASVKALYGQESCE